MNCIVTAGPTYEPLDDVRRLTNFSTGRLGCELASFLTAQGHNVTLLVGEHATYCGERTAAVVEIFTTTANLRERLQALVGPGIHAVLHAAAVSDFTFGKTWLRSPQGVLSAINEGKISTRHDAGTVLAELIPTPKLISRLREWFPHAFLIGWKFEVDGQRPDVIRAATKQITESRTDACVANGPAYGDGFGLVTPAAHCEHHPDKPSLFAALESALRQTAR